jgi:hypothetical protein
MRDGEGEAMKTPERDLVQLANMISTDAGHRALALLVDREDQQAAELWRWLVKRGAGR